MELQDLIVLALLGVCAWTFIPRHLRRALRSGLEPAVITLADAVREGARLGLKLLTSAAYRILIGAVPMSSSAPDQGDDDCLENAVLPVETNPEIAEIPQRVGETNEAIFHSGENTAIARLIASGVVKLTEGVKEGTGKRSGDAYSKRSKEIQALVKDIQDHYPQRTPEQEALRQQLHLGKH